MIDRILGVSKVLEKGLDAAWARNEAISNNIANVDTPGYKRKTVEFEETLLKAITKDGLKGNKTDKRHITIGNTDIDEVEISINTDNTSLSYRLDRNNVDIENEMALMAKNTLQYNTLAQKLSSEYKKLKSVIREGK